MSLSVYIRTAPELISEIVLKMGKEFNYTLFTRGYSNLTEFIISNSFLFVIVSDILNKRSLSHSFTSFCYFPYKEKSQLKIDHKTLTDSMYLEM